MNIRLCYEKTGRARYISHLDVMQVFRRAFGRARLPLRYSEGFNPHPYLSVALPLPVGVESVCERLDFGVAESVSCGTLPGKLNAVLPEGLRVTRAHVGGRPFKQIAYAGYTIDIETCATAQQAAERFSSSAIVEKRTKKKGPVPTDIVPMLRQFSCLPDGDGLRAEAVLAAGEKTLNPEYVAQAWRLYLDPEAALAFRRVSLWDGNGARFDGN